MLELVVQDQERWDEDKEEFITSYGPVKLQLEHSLISLSKWEQKWHKPYLSTEKDKEMLIDYIRCMTIGKVDPEVYNHISPKNIDEVGEYLSDPMTATWFNDKKVGGAPARTGKLNGEVITAEILYYDMFSMQIPKECEKWHLNTLIALIRVFGEKNAPKKKMSRKEVTQQYAALNAQRKARLGTRG